MVSAPFIDSFMLPVPEASIPAMEICSLRSAAGIINCRQRDAIVGQEGNLDQVFCLLVIVHYFSHAVNELDDLLGSQ